MCQNQRAEETNSYRIEQPDSISTHNVYNILKNRRRRIILRVVGRAQAPVHLDDLIKSIAKHESGDDSAKKRHSIRINLHQNHIPKLEDAEALHVNEAHREYQPGPKYHVFARIMAFVAERTDDKQPPVARGQLASDQRAEERR